MNLYKWYIWVRGEGLQEKVMVMILVDLDSRSCYHRQTVRVWAINVVLPEVQAIAENTWGFDTGCALVSDSAWPSQTWSG